MTHDALWSGGSGFPGSLTSALERVETGVDGEIFHPDDIAPIHRSMLMDQVRDIVADTIELSGSPFTELNYAEFVLLIERTDLAALDDVELQGIFLAAAFCAEKEDNPSYLRYLDGAFQERGIPLDYKFAYEKAVKFLQHKRRYDLYLVVSPYFAYRSTSRRVFGMPPDETIRLDLLEKNPSFLSSIIARTDARSLITLISYGILSIWVLSRETTDRIFFAIGEVDAPRRRIALSYLSQRYTLAGIISTFEGALSWVSEEWVEWLSDRSARVLTLLRDDAKYVASLTSETGTASLDAIEKIANPQAYQQIRAIVPSDGKETEPVELYPAPSMRRYIEKRDRIQRGESIPEAVSVIQALAWSGKIGEYREAALSAIDTIVNEITTLVHDIEANITSDHTRVALVFDTLGILIEVTAVGYALDHYAKEPRVFQNMTRIKILEISLSAILSQYADAHRESLKGEDIPSLGMRPKKNENIEVKPWLGEVTPSEQKTQAAIESFQNVSLLSLSEDEIRAVWTLWRDYVSESSTPVPSLTPERLKALSTELEYVYKRLLSARLRENGLPSEFLSSIAFWSREKTVADIASYGFLSVPTGKEAAREHYSTIATEWIAEVILEMQTILGILEVRYVYMGSRS